MKFIELTIKGISYSQIQTGAYALILEESATNKKISIIIGGFEAQSIALALEKDITSPRPLTHDLFLSLATKFNIKVSYVLIYKLQEGVFYSNIVFKSIDSDKEEIIDARTSDAIAIAVRFNAPIYTHLEVVAKAGIDLEIEIVNNTPSKESLSKSTKEKTNNELQKEIDSAIFNEEYEKAAKLRDELNKRNTG